MPSAEFLAAMKAHIKAIFPRRLTSDTTLDHAATKTLSVTYLNRGSIEHVEYAFAASHHRTATPSKSILKTTTAYDYSMHCYTATIHNIEDVHPALRDSHPLCRKEKKVTWADHATSNYKARPYNINGNRLVDFKLVNFVPEEHHDRETKMRIKKLGKEYVQEMRRAREKREREASGEVGLKRWFDFEGFGELGCGWFGGKKVGFEVRGVRKVPRAEGNGRIFC